MYSNTCTVCLEEISEKSRILRCKHEFHDECISSWFKQKRHCPMCRKKCNRICRICSKEILEKSKISGWHGCTYHSGCINRYMMFHEQCPHFSIDKRNKKRLGLQIYKFFFKKLPESEINLLKFEKSNKCTECGDPLKYGIILECDHVYHVRCTMKPSGGGLYCKECNINVGTRERFIRFDDDGEIIDIKRKRSHICCSFFYYH